MKVNVPKNHIFNGTEYTVLIHDHYPYSKAPENTLAFKVYFMTESGKKYGRTGIISTEMIEFEPTYLDFLCESTYQSYLKKYGK